MSSVLDEERREAFLQALQSLYEEQKEGERREREEKARQEEQLRRDLEEARRLRAENEAIERRRVDEERARRAAAASEVDYGIEERTTPSVAGSSRSNGGGRGNAKRKASAGSAAGTPKLTSTSKKGKAMAGPPSLASRAAMVLGNVRALVEHLGGSFQNNPYLLLRTLAFIIGLVLMFSRKNIRDRISRVLGNSWGKIRSTAGMGVKVSYI